MVGLFLRVQQALLGVHGRADHRRQPERLREIVNGVQVRTAQFAEIIYRDNPQDEGDPPPPYVVQNTLHDVPPNAGFAMGNRYEFGYRDNGHGWMIGILDGPELQPDRILRLRTRGPNGGIAAVH